MSGNKPAFSLLGRLLAIVGGIWGGALAIGTMFQQLNLGDVLRGELSLDVAFRNGGNALPFIVILFLLCSISIWLAASSGRALGWTGIAWTAIGGILLYGVYLARFSLGLLLIPSAGLILFAGLVTLGRWLVIRLRLRKMWLKCRKFNTNKLICFSIRERYAYIIPRIITN